VRRRTTAALIAVAAAAGIVLWSAFMFVPSPPPPGLNPAWHPAFVADFSGSQINTKVWATCYPWMDTSAGCTNFGNTEYEWYLPGQDRLSGGVLQLQAERVPTQGQTVHGAPEGYSCRSGMVTTYPGFRFQYGYIQVVARIPYGPGLWPALWMVAANQNWPPEIDIFEHYSSESRVRVALHPAGAVDNFSYSSWPATADLSAGWHTYGLSWTADRLTWYIDGKAVMSLTKGVPHQQMYLIANLAQSSAPQSGSGCSGTMLIRSVEVWRP
jgi:beta-glucanase (GH16 family)